MHSHSRANIPYLDPFFDSYLWETRHADSFPASQHYPDGDRCNDPACLTGLVLGELFSNGLDRNATCSELWREQSHGLDERLETCPKTKRIMHCVYHFPDAALKTLEFALDPHV